LIVLTKVFTQSLGVFEALILNDEMKCLHGWRTPNSSKDPNVSPSERQRKRKESGYVP
jgi:hypothetical protein